MSKPVRVIIIVGLILALVAVIVFRSQISRDATALAAYKAGLRAKGEKLTAEEFGFPRPPETSQNLALLIAGLNQLPKAQFDPAELELMEFVSAGRAEVIWARPQVRRNSTQGLPKGYRTVQSEWEDFTAQFETAAAALQNIRDATQIPPRYFFNDPANFTNSPKGPFMQMRLAGQWLMGDAVAALRAHQLDRAMTNLHALTQLAQFYREDLDLVSQRMRTVTAGMGLVTTWEALQASGWTEAQLEGLQKDWEAVDLENVFELALLADRAFGEVYFAYLRALPPQERAAAFRFGLATGPISAEGFVNQLVGMSLWAANSENDEACYLRHLQASLDAYRQLRQGAPWPVVSQRLGTIMADLEAVNQNFMTRYRHLVSATIHSKYVWVGSSCVRSETQRRLTITALALERFRLRHGKYPPELAALVPQFLSAVPIDLMSAKPLRYRLNADGTFTLYSVGEDGRDDGGDPSLASAANKFGLWEGKDAVWPTAVK